MSPLRRKSVCLFQPVFAGLLLLVRVMHVDGFTNPAILRQAAMTTPGRSSWFQTYFQKEKGEDDYSTDTSLEMIPESTNMIGLAAGEAAAFGLALATLIGSAGAALILDLKKKDKEKKASSDFQRSSVDTSPAIEKSNEKIRFGAERDKVLEKDRVSEMWSNRERLQTVEKAKSATPVAAREPKVAKDSASQMWANRERLQTSSRQVSSATSPSLQSSVSSTPPPSAPAEGDRWSEMWASREKQQSAATEDSSTPQLMNSFPRSINPVSPPPPSPPAPSGSQYMAGLGATSNINKSYSMSKWKPGASVAPASGSYLSNMSTSNAPAPAPYSPQFEHPPANKVVQEKKSYSMTGWTPYTKVAATSGGTGTYLDNMSAQKRVAPPETPVTPVVVVPSAPAIVSETPKEYIAVRPPRETSVPSVTGARKSYSMTEWVPGDRVNTAAASTSASAYLANMNLNRPAVAPSYSTPVMASVRGGPAVMEKPSRTVSKNEFSQSYAAPTRSRPSGRGAKSSHSGGNTSDGGSYSRGRNSRGSTKSPVAPYSPPTSTPSQMGATPDDYMANIGGGNNMNAPKKSYAMNGWKPGKTVQSGNSYLNAMNNGNTNVQPSYSPPKAKAPSQPSLRSAIGNKDPPSTSANPSPPPGSQSGIENCMSNLGTSAAAPPKKSYSMTGWKPGNSVSKTSSENSSYLSSVDSGPIPAPPSYRQPAAPIPSPPATAPHLSPPAFGDYMSNIGGGTSSTGGAKKSYSMSGWKPGSAVQQPAGSDSYLSTMASGRAPAPSSYSPPPPAISTPPSSDVGKGAVGDYESKGASGIENYMANLGTSAKAAPKKSYSMTGWKPGSSVTKTSADNSSYLSAVDSGPLPAPPSYTQPAAPLPSPPATAPAPSPPAFGDYMSNIGGGPGSSGGAKKSYSMSGWKPGNTLQQPAGSDSYLSTMASGRAPAPSSYSPPPPAISTPSSADVGKGAVGDYESKGASGIENFMSNLGTSAKAAPKKSYSMTGWKPGSSATKTPADNSSYLSSVDSGPLPAPPSYTQPAAPLPSPPATAPAPSPPAFGDYMSNIGGGPGSSGGAKKSYSMSGWKPGNTLQQPAGSDSYLSTMTSGGAPAPSSYSPPPPVSISTPPSSDVGKGAVGDYESNGSSGIENYMSNLGTSAKAAPKKSYSMTGSGWKPSNVAEQPAGSDSYLSTMTTGGAYAPSSYSRPPSTASPPSPDIGAGGVGDYEANGSSGIENYMSNLGTSAKAAPKKSYSMTGWKPGTSASKASADTASYLNSVDSGPIPVPPSYTQPAAPLPSSPATVPAPPQPAVGDYMSNIGGGSSSGGAKKSYSMSGWKPGNAVQQSAGSDSYLSTMTTGRAPAPSSYSPPPASTASRPSPDIGAGGVGDYEANGSGGIENYMSNIGPSAKAAPKKSYSMTGWKPGKSVSKASTDATSYLSSVDSGPMPVPPSYTQPASPLPSPPATAPGPSQPSVGDYMSNIGGGSSSGGAKKSYSMSGWKPGNSVQQPVETDSYLGTMTSSGAPTPSSYSPASTTRPPSPDVGKGGVGDYESKGASGIENYMSNLGTSTGAAPKKSYSMSGWKPGNTVSTTSSDNSSYLGSVDSGPLPVPPSYAQPTSPLPPPPASTTAPLSPDVGTGRGGDYESYGASGIENYMSNLGTSTGAAPKKSYSMSGWKPENTVDKSSSDNSSYLGSVDSGPLPVPPSYAQPASPLSSPPASYSPLRASTTAPPSPDVGKGGGGDYESYGASGIENYMSNLGTSTDAAPKKSYSMSGWKPGNTVSTTSSDNNSYLGSVDSGPLPVPPSYAQPTSPLWSPPASYSPPPPSTASPPSPDVEKGGVADYESKGASGIENYMSNLGTSTGTAPKKSYSMSGWKPGNTVSTTTSDNNSYSGSVDSGPLSVSPSYSQPTSPLPSPPASYSPLRASTTAPLSPDAGKGGVADYDYESNGASGIENYMSNLGTSTGAAPKKSYSMSGWNPGNTVSTTSSDNSSYLGSVDSGPLPVSSSYEQPANGVPGLSSNEVANGWGLPKSPESSFGLSDQGPKGSKAQSGSSRNSPSESSGPSKWSPGNATPKAMAGSYLDDI